MWSPSAMANYEEIAALLDNRYGDHHMAEAFSGELR
jgi:hypothetical protein